MKKLFIYILPLMLLVSCAKSLDDYNLDQKNPNDVPAGSLFANALKELSNNQISPSVNVNVFRFWVQQWAATTYQDEPRYNITTRNIPLNYWTPMYREVLQDLKESKRVTEADAKLNADVKSNRLAVIDIVAVYTWSVLVNTWGDVPYSEALGTVNQPKYDKAADIYADLFKRLDAAIGQLKPASANFGSSDLLYDDDTEKWLKFAHSLKMRLAITTADVNGDFAKTAIQNSASKGFTSNEDNAAFRYLGQTPNNNPISDALNSMYTSRLDYVAGRSTVDLMNQRNDPRRKYYFTPVNGTFIGGVAGAPNTYASLSHVNDEIIAPDFEGMLMSYAEVEFILAEAAARWSIAGTAAEHYNKAITSSITYWGGTGEEATTYLANPLVAYATAAGGYKEKIGIQKHLALYNQGYDAWIEWRRLDFPKLTPATNALSVIPVRLTYPTSERTLNAASVAAAAASIGGDQVSTKVFWDIL